MSRRTSDKKNATPLPVKVGESGGLVLQHEGNTEVNPLGSSVFALPLAPDVPEATPLPEGTRVPKGQGRRTRQNANPETKEGTPSSETQEATNAQDSAPSTSEGTSEEDKREARIASLKSLKRSLTQKEWEELETLRKLRATEGTGRVPRVISGEVNGTQFRYIALDEEAKDSEGNTTIKERKLHENKCPHSYGKTFKRNGQIVPITLESYLQETTSGDKKSTCPVCGHRQKLRNRGLVNGKWEGMNDGDKAPRLYFPQHVPPTREDKQSRDIESLRSSLVPSEG